MKKTWMILTLPVLVVIALWFTMHSRKLRWDVSMGSSTFSLRLGNGALEFDSTVTDASLKNFFAVPFASFNTLSYDKANPPFGLCLYDDQVSGHEELDPFTEKPTDPFRGNYPAMKQTAFGKPFALTYKNHWPLYLYDLTIPFWAVFVVSFTPVLWWGYYQPRYYFERKN